MFHVGAFYESVDPGGALTQINAVPDQAIFTSGVDLRVPTGLATLVAEAALYAGTGPAAGQVQSPTLRDLANQDVLPISSSAAFTSQHQLQEHFDNPRELTELESLNFAIDATGGAAKDGYGLVWLADGALKPTTGKMFSVKASASNTNAAGTWVNGSLTFETTLPSGTYQVVGMHAQGAGLVAARLVFIGGTYRPGVPGNTAVTTNQFWRFRQGRAGVYGQFDSNQPPTLDTLGSSGTAQVVILDLIKTK